MFSSNAVVIANDAASLRTIFVDLNRFVSQIRHFSLLLSNEQQIRVNVEIIQSIRILSHDDFENLNGFFDLSFVVIGDGNFGDCEDA